MGGLLIAAPMSRSGKTTITLGLLRALNLISGVVILAFALWQLAQLV